MKVTIHDFIPGGTVLDYLSRPRSFYNPPHVIAYLEGERTDLSLEITGELRVPVGDKVYTNHIPLDVAEAIRVGRVEPSLFPWFALRLVTDGAATDDVWTGDSLPKTEKALVSWLKEQVEKIRRSHKKRR